MSTLHGTLDKCAACPAKDLCPAEDECSMCSMEAEDIGKCISCAMCAECNFTPIPTDQPLADPT